VRRVVAKASAALLVAGVLACLVGPGAQAQTVKLTAQQQQMLNALPADQRRQALAAIQQINQQGQVAASSSLRETVDEAGSTGDSPAMPESASFDLEPRAESGSSLVVTFSLKPDLPDDRVLAIEGDPVLRRLQGSHAFVLDDAGKLSLQGLEVIPLLGLSEEDIERRLGAEPYLANFDISARILSSTPTGKESLKPFGYDIFEGVDSSLDPPTTGPVPTDYVLGPGDSVRVQLFGNVNGIYEYEVSRDGILNLPEIGPVTAAGIPFSEFRADLDRRVREMLIGTQVSVTMGELRTVRVFVLGDVKRPGSYVVGGFATISGALYRGGGISEVGSLRRVQLKRNGETVAELDLYDMLLRGDTSDNVRLQPGDVVFVPPIGKTVGVGGAVLRPAIYESQGSATVADAVRLAGGLAPDAFRSGARLERYTDSGERRIISVDLDSDQDLRLPVETGDVLMVPKALADLDHSVVLEGHVQRPGPHQWRPGLRLTDVISSPADLKPGVDDNYVLIRRELVRGRPIQVLSADLGAAFANPTGPENVRLEARDKVYVFSLAYGRQRVIGPLLEEIRLQSTFDKPAQQVEIGGYVRAPGMYPLEPGMRVSDLVRAGGKLTEEAYTLKAELTRYSTVNGEYRITDISDVDLGGILRGDAASDVELREHDHLRITRVPEWESDWSVSLEGEVKFPGEYRIRRGETLREVLDRAGGLTATAFPEGAVFLREALKAREQEQIDSLARRMESDLISLSLQSVDTTGTETLSTGQQLLAQLRETEAVGRLVIDLDRETINGNGRDAAQKIELRDGDRLLVPKLSQEVTVIGETQLNTSHLYRKGLTRDDYIELSGGLTRRADKKLIYVVRASGAVVSNGGSSWLGRGGRTEIRPGDTIVVPLETDRIRPLTFWGSVTQILYQGAIAVAAVKTFDN